MAGVWYRTITVALTNGSKRVTETAQLKALDVPSWAFGRDRMNDADAAAPTRSGSAQQATANRNARMGLSTSSNANDNSQGLRAAIMED